jgi:cell division protein FtsW (lipid II flippase)
MQANMSSGILRRYRWKELGLLIIPFLILLLEMVQLPLAQQFESHVTATATTQQSIPFSTAILPSVRDLIPIFGLIVALLLVNFLMSIFFPKADQLLLPLVCLMSGLGVLMALRLGLDVGDPLQGTRQLVWVILGLIICVVTVFVLRDMNWLKRYKYTWALLGIILVALTILNVLRVKNLNSPNHDQLNFGPLNLQPSELLKIFIVVFFAGYLSENRDILTGGNLRIGPLRLPPLRTLGPILLMLGISLLLFLVIHELGLALLIYGSFMVMIYLGSGKFSYVIVGLLLFILLGFIGYQLFGYVQARFAILTINVVNWQNWSQATQDFARNGAYQVVQGLIALANGGVLGAGFGLGHAGAFVPFAQSDMVFTTLGEEFGLAGLFAIIGIYLLIIYRGFRIAIEASDEFNQLLAAGLTSIFAIQSFIIVAGNMKFLPLTGLPLPFLSYGGSSIIANFIIIGILLRISYNTAMEREGLA